MAVWSLSSTPVISRSVEVGSSSYDGILSCGGGSSWYGCVDVDCCVRGGVVDAAWFCCVSCGGSVSRCALRSGGSDRACLNGAVATDFTLWIFGATPASAPTCSGFGNLLVGVCSCALSTDF